MQEYCRICGHRVWLRNGRYQHYKNKDGESSSLNQVDNGPCWCGCDEANLEAQHTPPTHQTLKLSEIEAYGEWIWEDNPTKYEYLRFGNYMAASVRYKPITGWKGVKLIGMTKPQKSGSDRLFSGYFLWLKEYDRGMPKEKECYGDDIHKKNKIMPSEAIIVIKD